MYLREGYYVRISSWKLNYLIIDYIQSLPRGLDLMHTVLKTADGHAVDFALPTIEHRLLIKVLSIDPLQRDPLCRTVAGGVEVMAALDFKIKTILHITGCVNQNADVRVCVRANPVRPVVLEGRAVVDQQLYHESTSRTRRGYCWWAGGWEEEWEPFCLVGAEGKAEAEADCQSWER